MTTLSTRRANLLNPSGIILVKLLIFEFFIDIYIYIYI